MARRRTRKLSKKVRKSRKVKKQRQQQGGADIPGGYPDMVVTRPPGNGDGLEESFSQIDPIDDLGTPQGIRI
jgi:hypothetical protein